jgi:hypothetical protein
MTSITLAMLLAFVTALVGGTGGDPATDAERAAKIKAGMVLNFVRYTEWPAESFAAEDSAIVITILGESKISKQLEETVKGQQVRGRKVEVKKVKYPQPSEGEKTVGEEQLREFHDKLRKSQVLFIGDDEDGHVESVIKEMGTSSVLTVSDLGDFAERGGMLGLVIREGRVAFNINKTKVQSTLLKVSSKLLGLAKIVETREAKK